MDEGPKKSKAFKAKKSGKKVKKKQENDGKSRHNRKAFCFSGGTRAVQRKVQHSSDKSAVKEHAPLLDKTPDVAPPFVVVVHGPPGCGKTTLIRSLIKHYTKQNVSEINGAITLVSSKHRRITIFECPSGTRDEKTGTSNVGSMIDLAKIADLALIMIDASLGYEMETFEFINVLQNHGMPKILGILTHLDKFPETKVQRKKRKEFKARFWAECYDGAKLFYFSGLQYGRYPRTEIVNLARYIAVQKLPLIQWRQAHPYLIGLRWEDTTDPNAIDQDMRRINMYGYVYGARMREGQFVHLCGVGDFPISSIETYTDPCPSPLVIEHERKQAAGRLELGDLKGAKKINNLRTLQERHKAIYAPGCDIGNVLMDKDAVYINLPKHKVGFTKKENLEIRKSTQVNNTDDENSDENDSEEDSVDEENKSGMRTVGPVDSNSKQKKKKDADEYSDEYSDEENLPQAVKLVRELQEKQGVLDNATDNAKLKMIKGGKVLKSKDVERRLAPAAGADKEEDGDYKFDSDDNSSENSDGDEEQETDDNESQEEEGETDDNESQEEEGETDEEMGSDEEENLRFKKQVFKEAHDRFTKDIPLDEIVYGSNYQARKGDGKTPALSSTATPPGGKKPPITTTFDIQHKNNQKNSKMKLFEDDSDEEIDDRMDDRNVEMHTEECWKLDSMPNENIFSSENFTKSLKNDFFVTGKWDSDDEAEKEELKSLRKQAEEADNENSDTDGMDSFGSFGKSKYCKDQYNLSKMSLEELDKIDLSKMSEDLSNLTGEELMTRKAEIMEARKKIEEEEKENRGFDETNNNPSSSGLNDSADGYTRNAVIRLNQEDMLDHQDAIPIGSYVRIILEDIPKLSVKSFDINKPMVLGGLLPGELSMSYTQCRIKRHRWSPKILKTNDPILASIGWRRFQTIPIYSMEDRNEKRMRFLKYTPEHMHCFMTFYGPTIPPKTSAIFIKNWWGNISNYRISATGIVLECNTNFNILKKLKLTGEPYKIFKNTAFIKNMFTSDLEVSKAIYGKIQTVSGIRGTIKKPEGTEGHFRATFEDKILMSDLILLKSWIPVQIKDFYNPMLDIKEWRRMKTIGELRYEKGIIAENKRKAKVRDAQYGKQIERQRRKFQKLKLPKDIESKLPFKSMPKELGMDHIIKGTKDAKKKSAASTSTSMPFNKKQVTREINKAATAVIRTDQERAANSMLSRLQTIKREKNRVGKEQKIKKRMEKAKKEAYVQAKRDLHAKENRKTKYVKKGKEEKGKRKKLRLED